VRKPQGGFPSRPSHKPSAAGPDRPPDPGDRRAAEHDPATTTRPDPKPLPVTTTKPTARGAVAGSYLLGTLLLCAAVGFGAGALVGAPVLMGLLGLFVGVPAGIVVVRQRFEDL
jgi:hypothetical protein